MVVWYLHVFKNFPQFVVIHTVKDFSIINEANLDAYILQGTYFPVGEGNGTPLQYSCLENLMGRGTW